MIRGVFVFFFFFSSRRRHTRCSRDWSSDVCSSDLSFEIYTPPYLFRGPRPQIAFAPSGVAWGSKFDIRMAGSDEIGSVSLIRTGSPQHALDSDIRSVQLEFSQHGDTLTAAAPPDGV